MKYLLPIIFRYASLVLQFLVVVLVTRRLEQDEAGIYFMLFGIINATYFMFGAGLPDGLVRFVAYANAKERKDEIRSMVVRASLISAGLAALMVVAGAAAGILAGGGGLVTPGVVAATAAWWLCYGITFFAAQLLVATQRASLGAFYFYPAMNISLFVTSVPYLLFAAAPSLQGTLVAAAGGGVLCAGAASLSAFRSVRVYPRSTVEAPMAPVFRLGLSIGSSRVLQSCLYWIPVWGVGLWHGAAEAALFATASRLNVAIAAVMAAIRFTIRPTVVHLAAQADWTGIGREGQRTATLATLTSLVALAGTVTLGPTMIALVFGEAYRGAAWILAVLLVGTLGESVGGAVDEILKMTDRAGLVLRLLIATVAVEALLVWATGSAAPIVAAVVQAGVFVAMYAIMLVAVWRQNGAWVGASPSLAAIRSVFRR